MYTNLLNSVKQDLQFPIKQQLFDD